MKQACPTQCTACPFRSTSLPGWLGGYDGPGAIHSSLWHGEPFFCHTRTDYEQDDWLERAMENGDLCLGALIFVGRQMRKGGWPVPEDKEILKAIEEAMRKYDADPAAYDVMEPKAFIDFHDKDPVETLRRRAARMMQLAESE